MKKTNKPSTTIGPGEDALVADLLIESAASARYGQGWLDKAHRGNALNLLRQERPRHKRGIYPVWEFLAGLASQARISLDTALAAFELDAQPVVGRGTTERVAEVLKHIGCTSEETYRMIRLSFAEVHGYGILNELQVLPRDGEVSNVGRCDETLRLVETKYPAELRGELAEMRTAVLNQFRSEG